MYSRIENRVESIKKLSAESIIYMILTVALLSCYFMPQVKMHIRYVVLSLLQLAYVTVYLFPKKNIRTYMLASIKWGLLFGVMMFLVAKPLDIKMGLIHPIMTLWIYLGPAFILYTLLQRSNVLEKWIVGIGICSLFLGIVFVTLQKMEMYQTIARMMTGGSTDLDFLLEMKNQGVGGFGIAYACGALSVFLFSAVLMIKKSFYLKSLILAVFVFTLYFIIKAQFATLLIITFSCIGLGLFLSIKSLGFRILVILIFPLLLFEVPDLMSFLADFYSESIGSKFQSIVETLQGTQDVIAVSGERSKYQFDALLLFGNSPIWGNELTEANILVYNHSHSTFLSLAAATGILGLFFYYKSLWTAVNPTLCYPATIVHRIVTPLIVFFGLLTIFNPTEEIQELSVILFFTIPLLLNILFPFMHSDKSY